MVNASAAAKRFGCTIRHLYRMVDLGWLARPTRIGARNYWTQEQLDLAELRRKLPCVPQVRGKAIEAKKDQAELARAFFACWDAVGLEVATAIVRAEGVSRPKDLKRGQHARLSFALRRAADAGMTVERMLERR